MNIDIILKKTNKASTTLSQRCAPCMTRF